MGDLYSSAFGTVVLQYKGSKAWMEVGSVEGGSVEGGTPLDEEEKAEFRKRGTYGSRCWTNFESAVATEVTERARFFEEIDALRDINGLCEKLIQLEPETWPEEPVGNAPPPSSPTTPTATHNIERIQGWRARIHAATSHVAADKELVHRLYSAYIAAISNAFCASRCDAAGCTRYSSTDGLQLPPTAPTGGVAIAHYPTGDRYEGEWVDGVHEGQGVYIWAEGDMYVGQWARGMKDGVGTCFYADHVDGEGRHRGDRVCSRYAANRRAGNGLIWVGESQEPCKLIDGAIQEGAVSDEERREILGSLGHPADHQPQRPQLQHARMSP